MNDDLEARLKAIEDKLTPDPELESTMKATNKLKAALNDLKEGRESQASVVWRLIHIRERYLDLLDELAAPKKVEITRSNEGEFTMIITLDPMFPDIISKFKEFEFKDVVDRGILGVK